MVKFVVKVLGKVSKFTAARYARWASLTHRTVGHEPGSLNGKSLDWSSHKSDICHIWRSTSDVSFRFGADIVYEKEKRESVPETKGSRWVDVGSGVPA